MAVAIRLSRGGAKKRPYYRIVVADSRASRDGKYLEQIGTYNPLLPKDSEERVKMDMDRVKHWLAQGAALPKEVAARLVGQLAWRGVTGFPTGHPEDALPRPSGEEGGDTAG